MTVRGATSWSQGVGKATRCAVLHSALGGPLSWFAKIADQRNCAIVSHEGRTYECGRVDSKQTEPHRRFV
jgi:hypothetical protein